MDRRSLLAASTAAPLAAPLSKASVPASPWRIRFQLHDGEVLAEVRVPSVGFFEMPRTFFLDGQLYNATSTIEADDPTLVVVGCYPLLPPENGSE